MECAFCRSDCLLLQAPHTQTPPTNTKHVPFTTFYDFHSRSTRNHGSGQPTSYTTMASLSTAHQRNQRRRLGVVDHDPVALPSGLAFFAVTPTTTVASILDELGDVDTRTLSPLPMQAVSTIFADRTLDNVSKVAPSGLTDLSLAFSIEKPQGAASLSLGKLPNLSLSSRQGRIDQLSHLTLLVNSMVNSTLANCSDRLLVAMRVTLPAHRRNDCPLDTSAIRGPLPGKLCVCPCSSLQRCVSRTACQTLDLRAVVPATSHKTTHHSPACCSREAFCIGQR